MNHRQNKSIKNIGIVLRLSYASGRELLHGISSFARANCHWSLRLLFTEGSYGSNSLVDDEKLDGIITSEPLPAEFLLRHRNVPLVVIGARAPWLGRRRRGLTFVRNDDREIGRYAAEYLLSLGKFQSFGFVPTNNPYYCSILRREGFVAHLGKHGIQARNFKETPYSDGSSEDIQALQSWLKATPKPAAIMVVHDLRATHVLKAAENVNLNRTSELAVIGVDNDELLCDFTRPQLTSIYPDHIYEGKLAARELLALLSNPLTGSGGRTVKTDRKTIIERESCKPINPGVQLASRAMSIIQRDALKGISPKDVITEIGGSRRLADLRFRECYGKSMLEVILELRLDAVKHKLETTTIPIRKILESCGFNNESNAKHFFKCRTGMTMQNWRNTHQAEDLSMRPPRSHLIRRRQGQGGNKGVE